MTLFRLRPPDIHGTPPRDAASSGSAPDASAARAGTVTRVSAEDALGPASSPPGPPEPITPQNERLRQSRAGRLLEAATRPRRRAIAALPGKTLAERPGEATATMPARAILALPGRTLAERSAETATASPVGASTAMPAEMPADLPGHTLTAGPAGWTTIMPDKTSRDRTDETATGSPARAVAAVPARSVAVSPDKAVAAAPLTQIAAAAVAPAARTAPAAGKPIAALPGWSAAPPGAGELDEAGAANGVAVAAAGGAAIADATAGSARIARVLPGLPSSARGMLILAVAALLCVAAAETMVAYGDPRIGIGMHIALLALTLVLAAQAGDARWQGFFMALAFAPIIRIASTGMPLQNFAQPYWYVLTSVPLFIAGYLVARECGLRRADICLRLPDLGSLPTDLAVAAAGVPLGYVEWRILRPAPMVESHSVAWLVAGALILLICTGLVEELLFRGVLQFVAIRLFGVRGGVLFSAGLFATLHIGHLSVLDDVFVLGVGLQFSLAVRYSRSLLGVTLAHGLINVMLFMVLPLGLLPT